MLKNDYTLTCNEVEKERLGVQARELYCGPHFLDQYLFEQTSIIDVGCGTGDIMEYISMKVNGCQVVGIDNDEDKIKINISKYSQKNILFRVGDVYDIDFPDNTFDLTYCRFLLMHLKNPNDALKEMLRITKPGGIIIAHEGIHDGIWLVPESHYFKKILESWKNLMSKKGQDHSIGLRLHKTFVESGLKNVQMKVLSHYSQFGSSLFDVYMKNWLQHLPSFHNGLKSTIKKEIFDKAEKDLASLGTNSSYIEITCVTSGMK